MRHQVAKTPRMSTALSVRRFRRAAAFGGYAPVWGATALLLLFGQSVAVAGEIGAAGAPIVLFTDVESGPTSGGPNNLGVPISIFGKGFGAVRGESRVTIGGVEAAGYPVWGAHNARNDTLDMIVAQPGPRVTGGAIVVTVNGRPSNAEFTFAANAGKIFYASPAGQDTNPGTEESPCRTILHVAADLMGPGDTLLVRGGENNEGRIQIRAQCGGKPGQSKTIRNYPGEEVILTNAAPHSYLLLGADCLTVSGLNFSNGKSLDISGEDGKDPAGIKIINNTFRGRIEYAAVGAHGRDHLIAGNVCDLAGSSVGTLGHCFYISDSSNVKILYNNGAGADGYGIHVFDQRRQRQDHRRVISNMLVEGNIMKNSLQRAGMVVAMEDRGNYGNNIDGIIIRNNVFTGNATYGLSITGSAPTRNIKVYNNTFYRNGDAAINVDNRSNISDVDIRNNLLYQATLPHIKAGSAIVGLIVCRNYFYPDPVTISGASDSAPVTGPVTFADPAHLDFHLRPGSAPINHGEPLPDVPRDMDGVLRPQGPTCDIGAYEHR